MGYAVAKKCALEYGMKVCIADINEATLEAKAAELRSLGAPEVLPVKCDVTKVEDYQRCADEVFKAFDSSLTPYFLVPGFGPGK